MSRSTETDMENRRAGRLRLGFSRRYIGGVGEFTVEAPGVIKAMDRLYPGLGEHLVEETTVAIDGAIHETAYFQPIREGCEIFFIPKLEGG
jgi:molybdopterin synthase sulfur carrier subunit